MFKCPHILRGNSVVYKMILSCSLPVWLPILSRQLCTISLWYYARSILYHLSCVLKKKSAFLASINWVCKNRDYLPWIPVPKLEHQQVQRLTNGITVRKIHFATSYCRNPSIIFILHLFPHSPFIIHEPKQPVTAQKASPGCPWLWIFNDLGLFLKWTTNSHPGRLPTASALSYVKLAMPGLSHTWNGGSQTGGHTLDPIQEEWSQHLKQPPETKSENRS